MTKTEINTLFNKYKLPIYIVGGIGLFFIVRKLLQKKTTTEETVTKTLDLVKSEEAQYKTKYKPSYPESAYPAIANAIYESIRYSGLDDNYKNTFNELLKIKNPLDLVKVQKYYGARQRSKFGIPDGDPETLIPSVSKELRSEIIKSPFSKSKYEQINDVWSRAGIQVRL
jgi:hypothetical protein